ncbi:GH10986 [Drosophila grimshawi]|uniref:GH10986 n=1 Tax=Drosophila grimshawi TaxID=7222 RepID=B4JBN8_DROGR|nr:GH10986 [Drosophila grimshawi]
MCNLLFIMLTALLIFETLTTLALSSDGNVGGSVGGSTVNNASPLLLVLRRVLQLYNRDTDNLRLGQ